MISVCLATHNGERFIRQQLDSILCQLTEEDEVVVSDDGSTDQTLEILHSYNDARIKIYQYEHRKSYANRHLAGFYYASANFGNALKHANGDYIFLSDQDDIWMSNKVSICLEALHEADIVCHNFNVIDAAGNLIEEQYLDSKTYTDMNMIAYWKLLPFRGCCLAFTKEILKMSVPIPEDTFEHDCWIGMNAILHGKKYHFISQPLISYRRQENNVSELKSPNGLAFKIGYRLKLLWSIIKHWSK